MTTTETTNSKPAGTTWQEAATASAIAQQPGDPPPKHFVERLPCVLSDRETVAVARRFADAIARVTSFNEETKQIASERKAKRTKLEAVAKEYEDATRTGRVQREVECIEYVSFQQNRKWRVRTDTNETTEEQPLTASERQTQLNIGGDGKKDADGIDAEAAEPERDELGPILDRDADVDADLEEDDVDEIDAEPAEAAADDEDDDDVEGDSLEDETTNITEPETVLAGGTPKSTSKKVGAKGISKAKKR